MTDEVCYGADSKRDGKQEKSGLQNIHERQAACFDAGFADRPAIEHIGDTCVPEQNEKRHQQEQRAEEIGACFLASIEFAVE